MRGGLVVVSLEPWDLVWRRNQHLVDGLLRADERLRVLFVEPPRDILHDALNRRASDRAAGLRTAEGYGGRLHLLQPTKLLPRVVGGWADASIRTQVRRAAARLGMSDPVLWVNDAHGAGLVRRTGWPSLYDVTDDWLAASRPPRELKRLSRDEQTLLTVCREVVVCSPDLARSRGAGRAVTLIPNAVDVDRYRRPQPRPHDLPAGATAVYVGTLHEDRLDVPLLQRTSMLLRGRGATVVLVGPNALSAASRAALDAAGVRQLGARAAEFVPGYLQHATALIVPHVVDAFTDSLDPIKLYEYRAVGRPVVSTAVAGFRDDADTAIADAADFPDAVAAAVAESRETVHAADVPDWSRRVAEMAEVLGRLRRV